MTDSPLLRNALARRDDSAAMAAEIVDVAESQRRALTPIEAAEHDHLLDAVTSAGIRVQELQMTESRHQLAAACAATPPAGSPYEFGDAAGGRGRITEPSTYRRGSHESSYFKDLFQARNNGNRESIDRLVRNDRETRALGNTGQTSILGAGGGSGGEFAPPAWLIADFVALARPSRVTADTLNKMELPSGIANVNLPKVAGGTTTAVQNPQNTAVSQTDLTSAQVSSSITTVAGKQIVSVQLLNQSGLNFDEVILADLAADYAKQVDLQVLTGSGSSGQLRGITGAAGATVTFTSATPTITGANSLYTNLAKALQTVQTTRYLPATVIVMHPRRWAAICAAFDTQNRPLIVPSGAGVNVAGTFDATAAQGAVGQMFGLPVYVDPNITITDGTNQDIVFVMRAEDLWLWESPLALEAFTATYADSLGVLFRCVGYTALIPDRYAASICLIRGTGLITPTF